MLSDDIGSVGLRFLLFQASGIGGTIYWTIQLNGGVSADDKLFHMIALCLAISNAIRGVILMVAIVKVRIVYYFFVINSAVCSAIPVLIVWDLVFLYVFKNISTIEV